MDCHINHEPTNSPESRYRWTNTIDQINVNQSFKGYQSIMTKFRHRVKDEFIFTYVHGYGFLQDNPEIDHWWVGHAMWTLGNYIEQTKRPWMLINGNTPQIQDFRLRQWQRRQIYEKSLDIFYFEPLFLCDENERWPWVPQKGLGITLPELEWLHTFLKFNKIPADKVTLYVNDYKLREFLDSINKYPEFKIHTLDAFQQFYVSGIAKRPMDKYFPTDFTKRFACLNYRYEAGRELLAAYLFERGESHLTYFHTHDRGRFLELLPFNPKELSFWEDLERGLLNMSQYVPMTFDAINCRAIDSIENDIPDSDGKSNQRPSDDDTKKEWIYQDSFVAIVNECRIYTPCPAISEKTLDPILYKRPFILNAGPGALEYMRSLGFETFGEFWDESYDLETCHFKRTEKIVDLIDWIYSRSWDELYQMNRKMKPLLTRNYKFLMKNFLKYQQEKIIPKRTLNTALKEFFGYGSPWK